MSINSVALIQTHCPKETIIDFDLILVMEDGMVAETGPPAELLSRPGSKFSRLAASQGLGRPAESRQSL